MHSSFSPVHAGNFKVDRPYISRQRNPFNDKRRHAIWLDLQERMLWNQSCVIHQLSKDEAESARFYRFLGNAQVSVEELIYMNCQVKTELLTNRHVLVLGDSTSYNLKSHMGRIQDAERIGVLDDNKTPGFMTHVHLAVDASNQNVLGLADILLWSRSRAKGKKPLNYLRDWQDKESYKWALGIDNASAILQKAACRTFVLDRDADNYDLFLKFYQEGKDHFVIRSRWDRQVQWEDQQLSMNNCLEQSSCLGTYTLDLAELDHYSSTSGKRHKRKARQATIEVRACPVTILPPSTPNHPGGPAIPVHIIEAREVGIPPDSKEPAVTWRLISSHPAGTFEQAKELILFYVLRWIIEQLFRTSKKKGFDLEATQLETFDAIQRQTVMVLHTAAKVLQLVYARGKFDGQPIEEVFDENEQAALHLINQKYQGRTEKQKNPYPESQTSWATWIIARLGGWKGYESRKPPGPITIKRGLDQFYIFLQAFHMLKPSG